MMSYSLCPTREIKTVSIYAAGVKVLSDGGAPKIYGGSPKRCGGPQIDGGAAKILGDPMGGAAKLDGRHYLRVLGDLLGDLFGGPFGGPGVY